MHRQQHFAEHRFPAHSPHRSPVEDPWAPSATPQGAGGIPHADARHSPPGASGASVHGSSGGGGGGGGLRGLVASVRRLVDEAEAGPSGSAPAELLHHTRRTRHVFFAEA
ncbi:hypothetical protein T484DRAFT_1790182 [Baffinella frigidus]|nr:hypothetical protein T484DRAFT_1790182 [Cryptophyta sp. CCMP2293]